MVFKCIKMAMYMLETSHKTKSTGKVHFFGSIYVKTRIWKKSSSTMEIGGEDYLMEWVSIWKLMVIVDELRWYVCRIF